MTSNSTSEPSTMNDTGIPFVHPGLILSEAIVLPIAGIIAISLRFWTRRSSGQGIKVDDWTILAALPFVLGMAAICIWGQSQPEEIIWKNLGLILIQGVAERAMGYPTPPYPVRLSSIVEEELTETTRQQTVEMIAYWVTWLLMIPANGLIKMSALLMYRRTFVTAKNTIIDFATKVMFIICLLWTIGFFLAQVFGCGRDFYKPFANLQEVASCNTNIRLNGLMLSDLLTDVIVWIIPIPAVCSLQMPVTRKLAVTGILLLATISLAAAAIRLEVEWGIADGGYSIDVEIDQVLTVNIYWSNIESGLALVAACLPTLKLRSMRKHLESSINSLKRLLSSKGSRSTSEHSNDLEKKDHLVIEDTLTKDKSTVPYGFYTSVDIGAV